MWNLGVSNFGDCGAITNSDTKDLYSQTAAILFKIHICILSSLDIFVQVLQAKKKMQAF